MQQEVVTVQFLYSFLHDKQAEVVGGALSTKSAFFLLFFSGGIGIATEVTCTARAAEG